MSQLPSIFVLSAVAYHYPDFSGPPPWHPKPKRRSPFARDRAERKAQKAARRKQRGKS
jgi:hypothetical protein